MENWIDRYVFAVVEHLPEKERAEVERELRSNIYDMLSENPSEAEIEGVLQKMGSPEVLAEEYRQNPRYLISPQVYNEYIRLLKLLVPIIGILTAIIGAVSGGVEVLQGSSQSINKIIQSIIQSGIESGVSGVLQTLVWTTIGFVIAERTGVFEKRKTAEWKLSDLAPVTVEKAIPISDAVAELAVTIFFGGLLLLWALDILPSGAFISGSGIVDEPLFSQSFVFFLIPVLIVGIALTVIVNIYKLIDRRWTNRVCAWEIADNAITAVMWVFLLMHRNIFSSELVASLSERKWSEGDIIHYISIGETGKIRLILAAIIVIVSLIQIGAVFYHRAKMTSYQQSYYRKSA